MDSKTDLTTNITPDPKFVHLYVHSDYSLSDGLNKVSKLVDAAKENNMPALGICDNSNFYGLVKFYTNALKNGVKPIIGMTVFAKNELEEFYELTLYAKNNIGYKNITLLISKAYHRGYYTNPVIDLEELKQLSDGVIVIAGINSDLGKFLAQDPKFKQDPSDFYLNNFSGNLYLAISRIGRANEDFYIHNARDFSSRHQIPLVAVNEVCFLKQQDFFPHEIRVAIHDGFTLNDPNRPKRYSEQQYFKTSEQMQELFSDIPEALENSVIIAKRCNVTIRLGEYFLPQFPTGELSTEDFLVERANQGLAQRMIDLYPDETVRKQKYLEYQERLDIELKVINQMGFPGYFLIVMEFINWSKQNNIPVGPGRGSGAGSLVAYSLGITNLDPLEFDLLFERFLNPERVSMPDFDVDFCMEGREQVIEHVAHMYGEEAVSQIITFSALAAKAAIRDVGRVLSQPYSFCDHISKLIPLTPGITLTQAMKEEPELQRIYDIDEEAKSLIDIALILEGVTRNVGKHAGGVIIAPGKITDFSPLFFDNEGKNPVTHFDKNDVEYAGLVKFDFLGLRTLTIIKWALEMINAKRDEATAIDIDKIPLDDENCYTNLKNAKTTAVFQLESFGMKDLISRLRPDCFEDIIALVALFRPGPLQSGMVDNFIARKHGEEEISYPDKDYQHESLKEILSPTYGIILYQEQVMQIAQVLSGYTLGGADLLRRAMGKKLQSEMEAQRATFTDGAIKNNVDGDLALKIFDLVEKFAGYGFNKSHSAAYALLAYQTLWLKTNFPAEFMAAVLSAEMDDVDKIYALYLECIDLGIKVLPPNINTAQYKFSVDEQGNIVFGLGAIKGVGKYAIGEIVAQRQKNGLFKDIYDLCRRIDIKRVSRKTLDNLVHSGAFDLIGPHRNAILKSLDNAIKSSNQRIADRLSGQTDMFDTLFGEDDIIEENYAAAPKLSAKIIQEKETEVLGFQIKGNLIQFYQREREHYNCDDISAGLERFGRKNVKLLGIIKNIRYFMTKKTNERMCSFAFNYGLTSEIEVTVFPKILEMYDSILIKNKLIIVEGEMSYNSHWGRYNLKTTSLKTIEDARLEYNCYIAVRLNDKQLEHVFVQNLSSICERFKTENQGCPLVFYYHNQNAKCKINNHGLKLNPSDELITELIELLGEENVGLEFA